MGEKLRSQLFRHGGGKDPRAILASLADVEGGKKVQQFVEEQLSTFIQAQAKSKTSEAVQKEIPAAAQAS